MKTRTGPILAALAASALAATAAGAGGSSSKSEGPPALGEFAPAFAAAYCDALKGCCDKSAFAYDETSCKAQLVDAAQRAADVVKRGKVIYDSAAVAACLDAYKARAALCVEDAGAPVDGGVEPFVEACRKVFKGTVPTGQECTESAECAIDPARESATCRADTRPGGDPKKTICFKQVTSQPGEACSLQGTPKAGEYEIRTCDARAGYCEGAGDAAKCRAYAKLGADCVVPPTTVLQCDPSAELTCDGTTRKCEALPAAGQPCTTGQQCAKSAWCETPTNPGPGPVTRTCQPKKASGAECASSQECASGACNFGPAPVDGGRFVGTCGERIDTTADLFEVSPRSCGFGPQGTGPEDAGIQPIKTASFFGRR